MIRRRTTGWAAMEHLDDKQMVTGMCKAFNI
jgi:hypothetical protein